MDKFLRFLAGMLAATAYGALTLVIVTVLISLDASLEENSRNEMFWGIVIWGAILLAVVGWIILVIVVRRRGQLWVSHGIFAAPFVAILLFTVGCFVVPSVN